MQKKILGYGASMYGQRLKGIMQGLFD